MSTLSSVFYRNIKNELNTKNPATLHLPFFFSKDSSIGNTTISCSLESWDVKKFKPIHLDGLCLFFCFFDGKVSEGKDLRGNPHNSTSDTWRVTENFRKRLHQCTANNGRHLSEKIFLNH